jgi:negative regulator of replication initiation
MKTIQLEDDVFAALENKVRGFNDSPNDVIKRLLGEFGESNNSVPRKPNPTIAPSGASQKVSAIVQLVQSPKYLMGDAKDRYFAVLEFFYRHHRNEFSLLENYRRGKRVNFARSAKTIEESGSSTFPEQIPNTPYYVLTNLSNPRKRQILEDILKMFKYSSSEIAIVLNSIPDSGISRPKRENIFAGFTM